jgi:hypothetical protein
MFNCEAVAAFRAQTGLKMNSLSANSRRILSATKSCEIFFRVSSSINRFSSSASGSNSLARSAIVSRFRLDYSS